MVVYPTYPKQLVLVRHGQSHLNVALHAKSISFFASDEARKPFLGIPDHKIGLTEEGVRQSRYTGVALWEQGFRFSHIYDSGYERTVRTLDHILKAYPEHEKVRMIRQHDISLRERETGYSYCLAKPSVDKHFPWMDEYWKTFGPIFAKPMGGESIAGTIDRIRLALLGIFLATEKTNVLISLHGRVLTAIRYLLEDHSLADVEEKFLPSHSHFNCGVTVYDYSAEKRRLMLTSANEKYW